MDPIALTPREVKTALSLKNVGQAVALWSDSRFPGFEDSGTLYVDRDDLVQWWKTRKDSLLADKRRAANNISVPQVIDHAEETELSQEEPEGIQGEGNQTGRLDYSKV